MNKGGIVKGDVIVNKVTAMSNSVLVISYDPLLLEFVGAAEGPFLGGDGKVTSFSSQVQKDLGRVTLNLGRLDDPAGVTGSGVVAVITWEAKAKGSAAVAVKEAYILSPGARKPAEVVPQGSAVKIR